MAGSTDAGTFCDLVANFSDEPDVAVWRTITAGLVRSPVGGRTAGAFPAFVRQLVGPRLAELGWQAEPGEDDLVGELRGLLIRTMAVMGDDRATQERAARCSTGISGTARPSTCRSWPPWSPSPPRRAEWSATSSSSSASARPTRRRTSCGTSTRWPTSTTRR